MSNPTKTTLTPLEDALDEYAAAVKADALFCREAGEERSPSARASAARNALRTAAWFAPLAASAPPEASGLRASIEQIISDVELKAAMEETRRPGDLTIPNVQRRIVARLRAALAATPDARPDPRAEAFEDAASAVDHMELPQGGNRCEERVVVAAVKLLRSLAALPASPQATTPAPSHDAKE
jgi:hypothetical protein